MKKVVWSRLLDINTFLLILFMAAAFTGNKAGYTATQGVCGWAGAVVNKAGYTAALVACGWAGAIIEVAP